MIKGIGLLALSLALTFSSGLAKADYVVYTSRASFEAALKSEATETFNELGSNVQSFPNGLSQANGLSQPIAVSGAGNFLLSGSASSLGGSYPANGTYLVGPSVSGSATDGITVIFPANTYTRRRGGRHDFRREWLGDVLRHHVSGREFHGVRLDPGYEPHRPVRLSWLHADVSERLYYQPPIRDCDRRQPEHHRRQCFFRDRDSRTNRDDTVRDRRLDDRCRSDPWPTSLARRASEPKSDRLSLLAIGIPFLPRGFLRDRDRDQAYSPEGLDRGLRSEPSAQGFFEDAPFSDDDSHLGKTKRLEGRTPIETLTGSRWATVPVTSGGSLCHEAGRDGSRFAKHLKFA